MLLTRTDWVLSTVEVLELLQHAATAICTNYRSIRVFVFNKIHITAQCGPFLLLILIIVILCYCTRICPPSHSRIVSVFVSVSVSVCMRVFFKLTNRASTVSSNNAVANPLMLVC